MFYAHRFDNLGEKTNSLKDTNNQNRKHLYIYIYVYMVIQNIYILHILLWVELYTPERYFGVLPNSQCL